MTGKIRYIVRTFVTAMAVATFSVAACAASGSHNGGLTDFASFGTMHYSGHRFAANRTTPLLQLTDGRQMEAAGGFALRRQNIAAFRAAFTYQASKLNGGPSYNHNYHIMAAALHRAFPNVIPIADDWGGIPSGPLSIVDKHYYPSRQWFLNHANLYNRYPRTAPKIFVGEYAVGNTRAKYGDFRSTLAETAFMIGMERNCDVVRLASYGVAIDNAGAVPCRINLIEFNDKTAFGRSSYWVQYLFNHNKPAVVYPTRVRIAGLTDTHPRVRHFFADAGVAANRHRLIIKVDNASGHAMPATIHVKGFATVTSTGTAIILHENNPGLDNTFHHPARVVPKKTAFTGAASHFHYVFQPYSITVLRLRVTR